MKHKMLFRFLDGNNKHLKNNAKNMKKSEPSFLSNFFIIHTFDIITDPNPLSVLKHFRAAFWTIFSLWIIIILFRIVHHRSALLRHVNFLSFRYWYVWDLGHFSVKRSGHPKHSWRHNGSLSSIIFSPPTVLFPYLTSVSVYS